MTRRQRKWLIIGAMSAAALTFALFKAVPIGLRMHAYSKLDQAVLAVPVVAVECEDRRDSTEGTLIDLGYAEFRLSGDVTLKQVAREDETSAAWGLVIVGEGYELVVPRAQMYEPYIPQKTTGANTAVTPVGWSAWVVPSEACAQFRREYLTSLLHDETDPTHYAPTFEFRMLYSHVRPLTIGEMATMSSTEFRQYVAIAIVKCLTTVPGIATLVLRRDEVRAIAIHSTLMDMHLFPDSMPFDQDVGVRKVKNIEEAKRICAEIVSTYRVKAEPDGSQAELWAMFHEACEGK